MNNDRRFEINNKIISVDQIKEISDYLQKTCNYYLELIAKDREKNNNTYISNGQYSYYAVSKPEVKYTITYTDNRTVNTTDVIVFNDVLNEPQYIKEIVQQLYISYRDNELNEETEHSMSIYLSLSEDVVYFSTSDKNMNEPSYNLNSYVRGLLESGEDRYSGIVKKKFFVKCIIGLAIGSIITLMLFFILLMMKNNGSDIFETLFSNGLILSLFGWLIAFAFGNILSRPIVDNLFKEIDNASSVYYNAGMHDTYKKDYMRKNEVLIGASYKNLEKRKSIEKMYSLSKKVILVRLIISVIVIIVLSTL